MIVLILTSCPARLRGYLTRWLTEISAGVFVGKVSARIREALWDTCVEECQDGRLLLLSPARNEQGYEVRSSGHHWEPRDFEGLTFLVRPRDAELLPGIGTSRSSKTGWSRASQIRRFGSQQ